MSVASTKINIAIDGFCEGILRKVFHGRYPLQPIYVERAVETAISSNTKVFKNGVLPPSNIEILMNNEDYQDFRKIENIYKKQVEDTARNFIKSEFKGQAIGEVQLTVIFSSDADISKGDVIVRATHHEASYGELK